VSEEKKEKIEGGRTPALTFRSFMVYKMPEPNYKRFEEFCLSRNILFETAITMLMEFYDFNWHVDELEKRIEELEGKKTEKKKISRMGSEKE